MVNDTVGHIKAGDKVTVPAGMPHVYWVDEDSTFLITMTPGYPDESFFETWAGLGHQFNGSSKVGA